MFHSTGLNSEHQCSNYKTQLGETICTSQVQQLYVHSQLDDVKIDEQPSNELRERIEPYLFEAGLDIDNLKTNARLIGQDLMLYQVIHKRKLELDDIKKG